MTCNPKWISLSQFHALALLILISPLCANGQNCQELKHAHAGQQRGGGSAALWPWDLLHHAITLDLTQGNLISGSCSITATPRSEGLSSLQLELIALTVDSVMLNGQPLAFTNQSGDLQISLPQAYDPSDTIAVTVYYGGDPITDPSGFGGFYTVPNYTYNLGVAFQSVPHSYGRAWFPCADNFTERSTYEFIITTAAPWNAWCNGLLIDEWQPTSTAITRHWRIQESMPAYLASVAAANYAVVRDSLSSTSGEQLPVTLVARPQDTTAMKNSFINLPAAFNLFEERFGPYAWERVGYVLTPQGAMEHATSIHYPQSIANGSLTYQDVMAHELAHHWFGNLITCERAEEMYINEGFAEYLAYLFIEAVNGSEAYVATVRGNHRNMLQRAHIDDQGWWALAEMPQAWTYGQHTYNKGADVLHTLRSYMGYEAFSQGLTSFLATHAFEHVNTAMLRDHLQQATGIALDDFFADWVLQPGWAAFEVENMDVQPEQPDGTYPTTVTVQQKQRGPAQPYHNVPMTISFMADDGTLWTHPQPVMLSGSLTTITLHPPFAPQWAVLNHDERISQAVTFDAESFTGPATRQYTNTDMRLTVNSTTAPFNLRVEEYWVGADQESEMSYAYTVSPDRYWRIIGNVPEGASISGRFNYDGRPAPAYAWDTGLMLDFNGLPFREDSLVMLYRPGPEWVWMPHPDQTLNVVNNATDRTGRIDINDMRPGEYCFAWRKSPVNITESAAPVTDWRIAPNPAAEAITVATDSTHQGLLELVDARGRLVRWEPMNGTTARIEVHGVGPGNYLLRFTGHNQAPRTIGKVMVE